MLPFGFDIPKGDIVLVGPTLPEKKKPCVGENPSVTRWKVNQFNLALGSSLATSSPVLAFHSLRSPSRSWAPSKLLSGENSMVSIAFQTNAQKENLFASPFPTSQTPERIPCVQTGPLYPPSQAWSHREKKRTYRIRRRDLGWRKVQWASSTTKRQRSRRIVERGRRTNNDEPDHPEVRLLGCDFWLFGFHDESPRFPTLLLAIMPLEPLPQLNKNRFPFEDARSARRS